MVDEMLRCDPRTCIGIQQLEKAQSKTEIRVEKIDDKFGRGLVDKTSEIRDYRNSTKNDLKAFNLFVKDTYVTKDEFRAVMKTNYLILAAVVLKFLGDFLS